MIVCALLVYTVTAETEEGQSGRSRVSDEQLNMALSDQRYLRRQLKCALGEAPCDPVGRRLKSKYCTRTNLIELKKKKERESIFSSIREDKIDLTESKKKKKKFYPTVKCAVFRTRSHRIV